MRKLFSTLMCFALSLQGAITIHSVPKVSTDAGCAENGNPLNVTSQGSSMVNGDFVIVSTVTASWQVSGASCSANVVTLTLNPPSDETMASGKVISVFNVNPSGYNATRVTTLTGSNSTTAKYSVASCPGTYVSDGTVGIEPTSITDSVPNTWTEVPGSFYCYWGGGCLSTWYAANATTNGTGNLAIHVNFDSAVSVSGFTGACMLVAGGLTNTSPVDSVANNRITSNVTTWDSATIGGTVTPELIVAPSVCANTVPGDCSTNACMAAAGGITFSYLGSNGLGGCPMGYYITSGTGTYTAGFNQAGPAALAMSSIVSFKGAGATGGAATMMPTIQ